MIDPSGDQPLSVTFVNPTGALGGGERSLLAMIKGLARCDRVKVHPSVILLGDGPLVEPLKALGVPVQVVPIPQTLASAGDEGAGSAVERIARLGATALAGAPALARFASQMREAVRGFDAQIVHSNGLKAHMLLPLLLSRRTPLIWHVRDFLSSRRHSAGLVRCVRSIRRDIVVIANSRAVAGDLRRLLPRATQIHVVHNAIDTDHFSPSGGVRSGGGRVRVGLVATYARWKGQDLFIDAVARLPTDVRAAGRFRIVGGPIYSTRGSQWTRDELRARAAAAGVEPDIEFIDFTPDPVGIYRDLDVVVHASTRPEPFGLTIAEGMSCGRAVIVSRAGGAAELFEPDVDAVATRPGDADELASAMARLIGDTELRARLGESARMRAVRQFSLDRLGRDVLEVYETVLPKRQ